LNSASFDTRSRDAYWQATQSELKSIRKRGDILILGGAAVLFALFSSVVLGVITKRTDADRLRYGLRCFAYFIAALIGLGWLMRLGHG